MNDVLTPHEEAWHHATATVETGARVAAGVRVWHYSHVRAGAIIGAGTHLGMSVYVDDGAILGERVKVQNHVSIYRGVVVEDDVFIGPSAVFTNDRHPRSPGEWTLATTTVRRGASIGAGAVILADLEVGAHALVGAGAVVTRDVPPHGLVLGQPGEARRLGVPVRPGGQSRHHPAVNDVVRTVCVRSRRVSMIQLTSVDVGPEEEALVLEVLRSKQLAQGPMVEQLEARFSAVAGAPHVVAVNNGTTALIASLQALGVGPGDEVITSPFTFVATLNAILAVGARARFADVGEDYNLALEQVEPLINERTVAVLPVDLFGQMADLPGLRDLTQQRGLALVEDAAQAHGADVGGRLAGSFGLGCFSLYATKNVTAGEGGLISTDDADLARRLRLLRNQGMSKRYEYESVGWNYRMTDLQAALAIPQLNRLHRRTQLRRNNAEQFLTGLSDLEALVLPKTAPARGHVWHQFTLRVRPHTGLTRAALAEGLTQRGVASGVYYPRAVLDYDCFSDDPLVADDAVPLARRLAGEVLSLPVHPDLTEDDVRTVVAAVRDICCA